MFRFLFRFLVIVLGILAVRSLLNMISRPGRARPEIRTTRPEGLRPDVPGKTAQNATFPESEVVDVPFTEIASDKKVEH
jgi:hypothetical protein